MSQRGLMRMKGIFFISLELMSGTASVECQGQTLECHD